MNIGCKVLSYIITTVLYCTVLSSIKYVPQPRVLPFMLSLTPIKLMHLFIFCLASPPLFMLSLNPIKLMHLFYFAWPRVSSGSDWLYVSPLSDVSPATSDYLRPYVQRPGLVTKR